MVKVKFDIANICGFLLVLYSTVAHIIFGITRLVLSPHEVDRTDPNGVAESF